MKKEKVEAAALKFERREESGWSAICIRSAHSNKNAFGCSNEHFSKVKHGNFPSNKHLDFYPKKPSINFHAAEQYREGKCFSKGRQLILHFPSLNGGEHVHRMCGQHLETIS